MHRNRSIAGRVTIVAAIMILAVSGSALLLREWRSRQAGVGHREPLPALGYCAPDRSRPCILSFSIDRNGKMVITVRTDDLSPPDFDIKIRHGKGESLYRCQRASRFSLSVICTGEAVPIGEALQFRILSTKGDILLAEGTFPIIGLALATPEFVATPTSVPFLDRPPR